MDGQQRPVGLERHQPGSGTEGQSQLEGNSCGPDLQSTVPIPRRSTSSGQGLGFYSVLPGTHWKEHVL